MTFSLDLCDPDPVTLTLVTHDPKLNGHCKYHYVITCVQCVSQDLKTGGLFRVLVKPMHVASHRGWGAIFKGKWICYDRNSYLVCRKY